MVHVELQVPAGLKASNTNWALKSVERVDMVTRTAVRAARADHAGADRIEVRAVDVFLERARIVRRVRAHQAHEGRRNRRDGDLRLVVRLQLQPELAAERRTFTMALNSVHGPTVHVLVITVRIVAIVVVVHDAVVVKHRRLRLAASVRQGSVGELRAGAGVRRFTLRRLVLEAVLLVLAAAAVLQAAVIVDDAGNFCDRR